MGIVPIQQLAVRSEELAKAVQRQLHGFACDWCRQHPTRPCPACSTRRRRAVRLVEAAGLPVEEAARRMRLPVARVERLLEEEADRRLLAQLRQSRVPNEPLRALFESRRVV